MSPIATAKVCWFVFGASAVAKTVMLDLRTPVRGCVADDASAGVVGNRNPGPLPQDGGGLTVADVGGSLPRCSSRAPISPARFRRSHARSCGAPSLR